MSASIKNLSSMTGMSEVELQRRVADLANSGKIKGLSALEQALVAQTMGPKQSTVDAFGAMSAGTQEPHALEEPAQVLGRSTTAAPGFAAAQTSATPSLAATNTPAALDRAAATAQQKMSGFFGVQQNKSKSVFDAMNDMISGIDIKALQGGGDAGSRDIAFEQLKIQMQRMSESMQALTNTVNQAHETAKSAINNLKA